MAFVRNAWYVAAWSSELDRTLRRQTILGEDVVMFRTQDGKPIALRDRCPHRLLPVVVYKFYIANSSLRYPSGSSR